ncbi:MAG: translesion error-prone DNA polymerase V autoproteolytic subunit [Planctomycetia bacterium]|nr:translesion error-prone DNA polymerase V autoproteolytic subunit [Planctomycetia bacterium]
MPRGGRRKGAGRPKGTGKFGVPTKAIRVPEMMVDHIMNFIYSKGFIFPIYDTKIQAGFPASLDDQATETLDLNGYLVKNPTATFFVRATGESMTGAGIFADDVLVVDKSAEAENGDIIIAVVNNEFTVKRFVKNGNQIELRSENPNFPTITIPEGTELNIWGVVKYTIHSV